MNMLPDERDRLVRVEEGIEYIKKHMSNLPASPETIKRLENIEKTIVDHTAFQDKLKERIAWVSGAFSALGLLVGYAIKYTYDHLSITFGSK